MGFTDLIIKLSNTKFARKFQYEPYIIKSVEYISPKKEDCILTIYKDADYLKSLMRQYVKDEHYISFEVSEKMESKEMFDKVVLFFSINDLEKSHVDFILSHIKKSGELFSIFYLNSSKFFEWTFKLTDRDTFKSIGHTNSMLEEGGFVLEDRLKLPKLYIEIRNYGLGG